MLFTQYSESFILSKMIVLYTNLKNIQIKVNIPFLYFVASNRRCQCFDGSVKMLQKQTISTLWSTLLSSKTWQASSVYSNFLVLYISSSNAHSQNNIHQRSNVFWWIFSIFFKTNMINFMTITGDLWKTII
jgi:hypothetical protein